MLLALGYFLSHCNSKLIILLTIMSKKAKHCLICQVIPPNVFALSCDHVVCLSCAAELTDRSRNAYSIICPACQDRTQFESDLYEELQQMRRSETKKINMGRKFNQQFGRTNCRAQIRDKDCSSLKYCKDHNDIDLSYVCKTCKDTLICGECVISGRHGQHQVVTIQAEGKQIKSMLQTQLTSLTHKLSDLKSLQSARITAIQQRKHELQDLRYLISEQYDQIRETIKAEELSILARCNELIELHKREEAQFRNEVREQIELCEYQRRTITELLDPFLKDDQLHSSRSHLKIETIKLIANYQVSLPTIQKLGNIKSLECKNIYEHQIRSLKEQALNRRSDSYGSSGPIKILERYRFYASDEDESGRMETKREDFSQQYKGNWAAEGQNYFNLL